MGRKRVAYVCIAITGIVFFLVFVPFVNPFQAGMDICPHSLLSHTAFFRVSITYLYFRFGGVYWGGGGVGYNFYTGYFC